MEKVTPQEKRTLANQLRQFERTGLISYGKYLNNQLEYSSKSPIRKYYQKYIEDQIRMNNEKIRKIDDKLK